MELEGVQGAPSVTKDPRFRAGRALVESGKVDDGGIEMFATLLEGTQSKHGDSSIEAAVCFYEYGNALFRSFSRRREAQDVDVDVTTTKQEDQKLQQPSATTSENVSLSGSADPEEVKGGRGQGDMNPPSAEDMKIKGEETAEKDSTAESDDVALALEMMENAFSIYDMCVNGDSDGIKGGKEKSDESCMNKDVSNKKVCWCRDWVEEQLPRVLTGIGDVFMFQEKHGDAVDAFTRAIACREQQLDKCKDQKTLLPEIVILKRRRLLTESFVLVSEALLSCPPEQDVKTTETCDLLVTASERVDFIRGYYDKARDELQEAGKCNILIASQRNLTVLLL
jgi:hypothetical protein